MEAAGTSGIELYATDAVTVENNEVFRTVRKANGADFNGVDTDKTTTGSVIQYNYVHDNGDGILLCQLSFGDSIAGNGGRDFWGTPLPTDAPDIGPYQAP